MIRRVATAVLTAALGACALGPPPEPPPEQVASSYVILRNRQDIDRHAGQIIVVEGVFNHVRGVHGLLRLDTGVTLLLPEFHKIARGLPWTHWVGWRMWVTGRLQAQAQDIEDWDGPVLYVHRFTPPRP